MIILGILLAIVGALVAQLRILVTIGLILVVAGWCSPWLDISRTDGHAVPKARD